MRETQTPITALFATTFVLTSLSGFAQALAPPTTAALVQVLAEGDENAKYLLITRFLNLPAHSVDGSVIRVLSDELNTLTDEGVQRETLIARGTLPEPRSGEYDSLVTDVLAQQMNPIAIPALVRVVADGYSSFEALVRFGDVAVPALVDGCRTDRGLNMHIRKCLDVLEQMLERPAIAATLSAASLSQIKAVAFDRMLNPVGEPDVLDPEGRLGDPYVLAAAAYLAVATRDPNLRSQVVALLDNSVAAFQARNIEQKWIPTVSDLVRQALAKFPPPQ